MIGNLTTGRAVWNAMRAYDLSHAVFDQIFELRLDVERETHDVSFVQTLEQLREDLRGDGGPF